MYFETISCNMSCILYYVNIFPCVYTASAVDVDTSHVPLYGKQDYLKRKVYLEAFHRDQGPPPNLSHIS